jgi:hypothetical protein
MPQTDLGPYLRARQAERGRVQPFASRAQIGAEIGLGHGRSWWWAVLVVIIPG